jgi:hypothetical protein
VCLAHGIIAKGQELPMPVDDNGCFLPVVRMPPSCHGREREDAHTDSNPDPLQANSRTYRPIK